MARRALPEGSFPLLSAPRSSSEPTPRASPPGGATNRATSVNSFTVRDCFRSEAHFAQPERMALPKAAGLAFLTSARRVHQEVHDGSITDIGSLGKGCNGAAEHADGGDRHGGRGEV